MTTHEQFVLIWKGIDSKPATCIRYMNDLFQSYSSNLGSSSLFKHPSINAYGLHGLRNSGIYFTFGWWDI